MNVLSARSNSIYIRDQTTFKGNPILIAPFQLSLTDAYLTIIRHVKVHHKDKSKDDPELRRVLAQRPEGGPRGRRRRAHS